MEVRSREDPYMVFAYTRDNLGTDFKIFLYMSVITMMVAFVSIITIIFTYAARDELSPRN